MVASLSAEELAAYAGTSVDRVRAMSGLAILTPRADRFAEADVGRVVVIEALASEGVSLSDLADAVRSGTLSLGWFDGLLPPVPPLDDRTFRMAVGDAHLPDALIDRLFTFWGVATPPPDSRIREDDAVLIDFVGKTFAALDRDERLLLSAARYFGDNVRRIAESQMDFFRREMIEPMLASGVSFRQVVEELNPFVADVVRPAVHHLLLWLYRRHVDAANTQMLVQLVEASLQEGGVEIPRTARPPTIAFLDLSGFTRLTDQAGDEQAVALASALTDLVRYVPSSYGGRAVKLLGDGVMLHFVESTSAVRCALQLVADAEDAGLPPARVGVHAGPVVFRDGDYFGRTVNVAARITDYARPREVLVSDAVAVALADEDEIDVAEVGPVALKGVSEPVRLYAVRPVSGRKDASGSPA